MKRVSNPDSLKLLTKRITKHIPPAATSREKAVNRLLEFRSKFQLTYPHLHELLGKAGFRVPRRSFDNWVARRNPPRDEAVAGLVMALDVLDGKLKFRWAK